MEKLGADKDITQDDPRVVKLKLEIDRLKEVADSNSLWDMWKKKGIVPPVPKTETDTENKKEQE